MNPGDRIIVMKGSTVFWPPSEPSLLPAGMMTLDRDISGEVLIVYPDGSPLRIELAHQVTVLSGLNWIEGQDFKIVRRNQSESDMG